MNKNYLLRRIETVEENGVAMPNSSTLLKFSETEGVLLWDNQEVTGSVGEISISDVQGLQPALAGKADTEHTHTIEEVDGLTQELAGKAGTEHTHVIADVQNLQTTLDSKAGVEQLHTHTNKPVLDDLSDEAGELYYKGQPVNTDSGGGGGGAETLLELTDTPSTYGTEGQVLAVNSTGNAVEWVTPETGGGGGVATFTDLSDTPADYTGNGGKVVSVKADESGLEYVDPPTGGGGGDEITFGIFTPTERYGVLNNITDQRGFYWKQGDFITIQIFLAWQGSSQDRGLFIQNLPELPLENYVNLFVGTNNNVLPYNSSGEVGQVWYAELRNNVNRVYIHDADRLPAQTNNYGSGRFTGVFLQGTYKYK